MMRIEDKYYITSTTDKNGIITDVSNAFCTISGYTKEELIGKSHNIVRHPDMKSEVFKELWKSISMGKIWNGEVKNRKKDGDYYWVESTIEPLFDISHNIVGYKSIRFNITDRKKMEQFHKANLELLEEFRLVIETVNTGIAFVDNTGYFLEANPYILDLLGYTLEEIKQERCSNLTVSEFIQANCDTLAKARTTQIAQKIEKQCIRKDGSLVWTETIFQYFNETKMLIVVKNIEAFKELERKNKLFLAQAKQASMGEMIAMIAHQWRQPLTTVITILSKMKIQHELGVLSKDSFVIDFNKTKSIIQHLSKTIDNFQDYFKEKKGNPIFVATLFNNVSNIVLPILESGFIEFVFENNSGDSMVDDRLDQVLLNIFQNSADALRANTTIEKKRILTSIHIDEKEQIVMRILDNGGGISDEIIDKIFIPYFSTKSKNGSGLGLYMSKDIVENQIKGKIKVLNIDGGACFEITVPQISKKN